MRIIKTIDVQITRCWESCPYFGTDGNVMVCQHPAAPDMGYIIDHPHCVTTFPQKCPEARAQSARIAGKELNPDPTIAAWEKHWKKP